MVGRYLLVCSIVFISIAGIERDGVAALEYGLTAGSITGVAADGASASTGRAARVQEFQTLRGGVQLINVGQWTRSHATYSLGATKWIEGAQNYSLSHMLGLGCSIEAGPTTIITLDASANLTQLSMLDSTATMADPQAVSARPAGSQDFLTLQAGESLAWQPNAAWRISETVTGRLFKPIDSATTSGMNKSLAGELQLSRIWTRDAVGLRGRAGEVWPASTSVASTTTRNSRFFDVGVGWTHQWTEQWGHDASAGVSVLQAGKTSVQPAASAGLIWRNLGNIVELRVGQGSEANVYVGTAYQRRFAGVRVSVPVNRLETLQLAADGNVEHDWTTTADGSEASANVFSGRAGLAWQISPAFSAGLSYTIRDQHASGGASGQTTFVTIRRQMAMLTIEGRYPTGL